MGGSRLRARGYRRCSACASRRRASDWAAAYDLILITENSLHYHYYGSEPDIHVEKLTNGTDADSPKGPYITKDNPVNWTYVVTKPGNTNLTTIQVADNMPGVTPVYKSGDLNGDGWLNLTETWIFNATGTAVPGQYANIGTSNGTDPLGTKVTATDPSHYYGSEPDIHVEKLTNGSDADSPKDPNITKDNPVNWTYVVTIVGNVNLTAIDVVDNVSGVDPAYKSGDTNNDDWLNLTETWIFNATGTAEMGQYANIGTANGTDLLGKNVTDTDPSHYFGVPKKTCMSDYKNDTRGNLLDGWTVFVDDNGDGLLDTGETNTTTSGGGYWQICDLDSGTTYRVCEVNQTGWTPFDPASGCRSVTAGDDPVTNVNFTNAENEYCLSGYKLDNRTKETLPGWLITVYNSTGVPVGFNTTNATGQWQVCGLVNGTYTVCETNHTKWTPIDPESGCQDVTIAGEGEHLHKVNFTNFNTTWFGEPEYCLSGYKLDNRTGSSLEGWTINVTNSSGLVDTVTTDADGWWQVCHLVNGTYTVCETNQTGWTPIDPASDCQEVKIAGENESLYKVNFSNARHACMSGHKYDARTEDMLGGWTIFIDTNGNSTLDSGERSTITDGNGYWEICGLSPGDYMVCEVLKPGWNAIHPVTGCQSVPLAGANVTDIDFSNDPRNVTMTKKSL